MYNNYRLIKEEFINEAAAKKPQREKRTEAYQWIVPHHQRHHRQDDDTVPHHVQQRNQDRLDDALHLFLHVRDDDARIVLQMEHVRRRHVCLEQTRRHGHLSVPHDSLLNVVVDGQIRRPNGEQSAHEQSACHWTDVTYIEIQPFGQIRQPSKARHAVAAGQQRHEQRHHAKTRQFQQRSAQHQDDNQHEARYVAPAEQ